MRKQSGSYKDWDDGDADQAVDAFFEKLKNDDYDADLLAEKYIKKNIRRMDCKIYRLKNKLNEYGMYINFAEMSRSVKLMQDRLLFCQSLLDALESGMIEIDTKYI